MKRIVAMAVLSGLLPAAGFAEDLAKSGKYTGRYDWVFDGKAFPVGQDRTILSGNLPGVVFNDAGKGFLHNARMDCQVFWDINKGQSNANGSCIGTDGDGDKALAFWKCAGTFPICDGEFQWDGGTGKYKGLSGNNKFRATAIGQTQSGLAIWNGEWKLP
jgi:hypothetical protein